MYLKIKDEVIEGLPKDADITEIITRLAMKEAALKASYAAASKIGNLTILDFLR